MQNNTKNKALFLYLFLIFSSNFSSAQNNQTHFKSEIDFGGGTVVSTFLDVKIGNNKFKITSPKNADVRVMGGKARLGRVLGKSPKKGVIITINGIQDNDSLIGETNVPMFGKLKFRGIVKDDKLTGNLFSTDGSPAGSLKGTCSTESKIIYTDLYPKILKTIRENIYSATVLQTNDWRKFEMDAEKLFSEAHDDIELFLGFNMLAQKLPFSHLNLLIVKDTDEEKEEIVSTNKSVIFEKENATTAYLKIKNFSSSTAELAATLPMIVNNPAFKSLIIDLRDNGGGGINAAFELAKYIVLEDLEVGYFPTNKLSYSGFEPELFKKLPALQPKSTNEFGEQLRVTPGVKLIFKKPANNVFTGKIYVLTNGRTGSTCEPIVYALKNTNRATVIGEKTFGGMLAASPFVIENKYTLMLPISDFYTYDGVRLDRVGVSPNIEVKSADALEKALEIINGLSTN